MTDPIIYDPSIHVIVPREPTRGFKSMTDEGAMALKCHEDTPVMDNRTKIATAVWNAMLSAAPPITIDAPPIEKTPPVCDICDRYVKKTCIRPVFSSTIQHCDDCFTEWHDPD